jgi:hypothetical protein
VNPNAAVFATLRTTWGGSVAFRVSKLHDSDVTDPFDIGFDAFGPFSNIGAIAIPAPGIVKPDPSALFPAQEHVQSAEPVVSYSATGFTINLKYTTAALNAPQSFRDGIQTAANIIQNALTDHITVNLTIDYTGTGGGAFAGPNSGHYYGYSNVRTLLINNASAGDHTFDALPAGSSIQGQSNVAVWAAQEKLYGLNGIGANDTTTDDGDGTFATDIAPNLLVGVALHELTHAMGRIPFAAAGGGADTASPDIFNLFRFTSPGTRFFDDNIPTSASYFSIDGGNTKLADYGQTSDPSDFLNSGVQGPNDPFNEFYGSGTLQTLTAIDLQQLDALGFHLASASGGPGSVSINDVSITEGNSGTKLMTFTVTRSGGTAAFAVNYATAANTASGAAGDYVATSGTVSFGTSVNTQTISITINGDTTVEANETFFVNLSGATNGATISDSQGVGTILNDDAPDDFPANVTTTGQVAVGGSTPGFLEGAGDHDWFRIQLVAGATYTIAESGADGGGGTLSDPFMRLYNSSSQLITSDDDSGPGLDSQLTFTPSVTDTYYVDAGGFNDGVSGTYRVALGLVSGPPALVRNDFDGDGKSDILWRNDAGTLFETEMNGLAFKAGGSPGTVDNAWQFQGTGDFDGDGKSDILWRNSAGAIFETEMNGLVFKAGASPGTVDNAWRFQGTGDFDGDGKSDILWRSSTGAIFVTEMNGLTFKAGASPGTVDNAWQFQGIGDFDGDGKSDILWRNSAGTIFETEMNGLAFKAGASPGTVDNAWHFQGIADFDADGKSDILWRSSTGAIFETEMNGLAFKAGASPGTVDNAWHFQNTGDYNGDGKGDILWRNDAGAVFVTEMNGLAFLAGASPGNVDNAWHFLA